MIQEAIVTGVYDDGTAEVVVERAAICGGDCSKCDSCQYQNLIKTRVRNPLGALRGQRVHIDTSSEQVFRATVAIYLVPLIFFFVGYGLGALARFPQSVNILFSFVFRGVGALLSSILLKKRQKKDPTPSTITDIIPRD